MAAIRLRTVKDIDALEVSGFTIERDAEDASAFMVYFDGPKSTPYEGGVWRVECRLPKMYPFKSPSVGFRDAIFHPNIDGRGAVCLDVLNQQWTPVFTLKHVFDTFLPQLLTYPNTSDPLNKYAAEMLDRNKDEFNTYVHKHMLDSAYAIHGVRDKPDEDDEDDEGALPKRARTAEEENDEPRIDIPDAIWDDIARSGAE